MKISIITVCKNSEMFLQQTIDSVACQHYKNIEFIIVDGNSTDATLGIIELNSAKITKWLSEADKGMYDAINKGLAISTGDYILILNSDDQLASSYTINEVVDLISKEKLDYYYGNMIKLKDDKLKKIKLFNVTFKELLLSTHCTFAPHPCFFISGKLNRTLCGYDNTYKYAGDYDYILRALSTKGAKGLHMEVFVSKFRIHQNSITASGKIDAERKKILLNHGFFEQPYLSRLFFYYALWIYYKIINLGQRYKIG